MNGTYRKGETYILSNLEEGTTFLVSKHGYISKLAGTEKALIQNLNNLSIPYYKYEFFMEDADISSIQEWLKGAIYLNFSDD